MLDENEFCKFFKKVNAEPRWVTSTGKRSIQIMGLCHNSNNHSALFDPTTLKVNCFSACNGGMLFHTWVKNALNMNSPQEAKNFILEWIGNQDIDLSDREKADINFEYKEKPYKPQHIEPLSAIPKNIIDELYSKFDTTIETLEKIIWCKDDKIPAHILKEYDVALKDNFTIILPHHNINGDIVGLYERNTKPIRKYIKENYPDMERKDLVKYPRAKYVPLLRDKTYQTDIKTSWSFPNSQNLYGLYKSKDAIKETGIAIVFEGAKSVMLAKHYGYCNAVATHTFGVHQNHISMLIECGAKEIILAFDKQYQDKDGQAWELYEKKTSDIAAKVNNYVKVSRMIDIDGLIGYKDAPIDKGKDIFDKLYSNRENLSTNIDNTLKQPLTATNRELQIFSAEKREERRKQAKTEFIKYQAKVESKEKNKILYFRNKPIEWILQPNYKTQITENTLDPSTPFVEDIYKNTSHLIKYGEEIYTREQFLKAMFPDYKKYPYKVEFNNDRIFYLGSNQRAKLQYHILSQYYKLVSMNEQDKKDLEIFSGSHDGDTAKYWCDRMEWENGHEKMISFGAALGVRGVIKDVWCYTPEITDTYAKYSGEKISWDTWGERIKTEIGHNSFYNELDGIKNNSVSNKVYISMYYQNGKYLTLPKKEIDNITEWIKEYHSGKKLSFPYQGEIPYADMEFIIDFEKDIKIVENLDLSEYNKMNNDRKNKERGKLDSWKAFSGVVGDKWTTAEIKAQGVTDNRKQGFSDKQIRTWRDYGWIEKTGKIGAMFVYQRVNAVNVEDEHAP